MDNLDSVINHMARAAAWAEKGGRPEIAEYFAKWGEAAFVMRNTMAQFLQEVLGYRIAGGSNVDESPNKETA